MTTAPHKNAIERRLDELQVHWDRFAEQPNARLLCWQADDDTTQLIEVFLEVQREGGGEVPDLFVRFTTPFTDPARYGYQLTEEFRRQYEEGRAGLADTSVPRDWVCPGAPSGENDVTVFLRCCLSFRAYYAELSCTHLVLALTPREVTDPVAWRNWLLRLVRAGLPANIRALVLDSLEQPVLAPLLAAEPKRIAVARPDLNLPAAYQELIRAGKGSGPGNAFRRLFVALTGAAQKDDLPAARRTAKVALKIAERENWLSLQVAVHMALGGALLAAEQIDEALTSYRAALQAAEAAVAVNDPAGPKLLLPARFAEGAALIAAGRFAEAAAVYEAAAPVAAAQNDHFMTLEGWRMAAYCHEQTGAGDPAWRCGEQALAAGAALDVDARAQSTLSYAGQGLLRLTQQRRYRDRAAGVRRRLTELLGPAWEEARVAG
jgi:tetratricopeptide (TPR) repeat protein